MENLRIINVDECKSFLTELVFLGKDAAQVELLRTLTSYNKEKVEERFKVLLSIACEIQPLTIELDQINRALTNLQELGKAANVVLKSINWRTEDETIESTTELKLKLINEISFGYDQIEIKYALKF